MPTCHTKQKKKLILMKKKRGFKVRLHVGGATGPGVQLVYSPELDFPANTFQLEVQMDNTKVRKEQSASEDTVPVLPSSPRADNGLSKGLALAGVTGTQRDLAEPGSMLQTPYLKISVWKFPTSLSAYKNQSISP